MNTYKPTFSQATSVDELELLQWGRDAETMMVLPSSSFAIENTSGSFKPASAGHSVNTYHPTVFDSINGSRQDQHVKLTYYKKSNYHHCP